MNKISSNKYLDTLLKVMLGSAIFHSIILVTQTIVTKNLSYLNIVNVLGLNWFFPNAGISHISNALSIVGWIIIYIIVYLVV